jgi:hypothetical protein
MRSSLKHVTVRLFCFPAVSIRTNWCLCAGLKEIGETAYKQFGPVFRVWITVIPGVFLLAPEHIQVPNCIVSRARQLSHKIVLFADNAAQDLLQNCAVGQLINRSEPENLSQLSQNPTTARCRMLFQSSSCLVVSLRFILLLYFHLYLLPNITGRLKQKKPFELVRR